MTHTDTDRVTGSVLEMRTYIHTCMHICTYVDALFLQRSKISLSYIHTYIHTHIHTYLKILMSESFEAILDTHNTGGFC